MSDPRSLLERESRRFIQADGAFERLQHRRDCKRRNQRIRAGVLGLAITIALGWAGIDAIRSTGPVPADDRSQDLGIFAPVSGRILYVDEGIWAAHRDAGFWAVDPNGPSDTVEGPSVSDDVASTLVPLNLEDAPRRWSNGDGLEPLGWSSDGTELLVTHWKHFAGTFYVHHADGTETRVQDQVPSVGGATAAISPDGSRVVFEDEGLTVVDVEGGRAVKFQIPAGDEFAGGLTFSPDGTQIAYIAGDAVWVVNADGSDAHEIVANEATRNMVAWFSGMQWSPAGDRIAIGLGRDPSIYAFAPDGSNFRKVISGGISPFWSPDGSQIAYTIPCDEHPSESCQPGDPPAGLAIADADGSNVRALGFAASGPWHPGE